MSVQSLPKLIIDSLSIEVTRECNMTCEICLRGARQNIRMSMAYIDRLLQHVEAVTTITFTGGEPSLNLQAIPKTIALTEKYGIPVSAFYVVTNGAENQEQLALELLKIYPKMEEPDACGISLSIDQFHDTNHQSHLVKGLAFYRDYKEHDPNNPNDNWVMATGRAKEYDIGSAPTWLPTRFQMECTFNEVHSSIIKNIYVDELYLSCNGYCYPSCDLPYELMDKCKMVTPARLRKELTAEMYGMPSLRLKLLHQNLKAGLEIN